MAKTSNNKQHAKFKELARELEADKDPDAADRLLGRLAKSPPDPKKKIGASKPSPKDEKENPGS